MGGFNKVFNGGTVLYFWIVCIWVTARSLMIENEPEFVTDGRKSPFKFISLWNYGMVVIYFHIMAYMEFKKEKPLPQLENFRNYLLYSLNNPLTFGTAVFYWFFHLYDRELIFPIKVEGVIPQMLPHHFHTIPPILLLIHLLASRHDPPPVKTAFKGYNLFLCFYISLFFIAIHRDGKFPYIFFTKMSSIAIAWLIMVAYVVGVMFLLLGYVITRTKPKAKVK